MTRRCRSWQRSSSFWPRCGARITRRPRRSPRRCRGTCRLRGSCPPEDHRRPAAGRARRSRSRGGARGAGRPYARERAGGSTGCEFACVLERDQGRLSPQLEDTIYRVVQEALSNVVRHSGATRASVDVKERDGRIVIAVRDDGAGFVADGEPPGFRSTIGMREADSHYAGGEEKIQIKSSSGGAGTLVQVTLPAARSALPPSCCLRPGTAVDGLLCEAASRSSGGAGPRLRRLPGPNGTSGKPGQ